MGSFYFPAIVVLWNELDFIAWLVILLLYTHGVTPLLW